MIIPVATLQREWGHLVQPLKTPTQVTPIPTAYEFHSRVGNSFPKGGRTDFSENLRATLFNNDLSDETTFSQIHFSG
jgi:hypothetical protein